jgi:hypothetical protein
MSEKASLVPRDDLPAQLPRIGAEYFMPEALELCRSLKGRQVSDLSDDEILMLAFTAAQAALVKHVEPGNRDAEETLNTILSVLDHNTIVQAEMRKLHALRLWSLKRIGSKELRDSGPTPHKRKGSP